MIPINQQSLTVALPVSTGFASPVTDQPIDFAEVIAGFSTQPEPVAASAEAIGLATPALKQPNVADASREPAVASEVDKQVVVSPAALRLTPPAARAAGATDGEAIDVPSPIQSGAGCMEGATVHFRMPKVAAGAGQASSSDGQVDGDDDFEEPTATPVHEALAAVIAILPPAADLQKAQSKGRMADKPDQNEAPEQLLASASQQRTRQPGLVQSTSLKSLQGADTSDIQPSDGLTSSIDIADAFGQAVQAQDTGAARNPDRVSVITTAAQPTLHARHIGDAANIDLHQLDALVKEISEITGGVGRASFRVAGDQLGPLEVRLHTSDAGVSVSIRTETEQSHATVTHAQRQLTDDMRANGLRVAETSVTLSQGGAHRERSDRHPQPGFAPQIESALPDSANANSSDERRPAGRYA